MIQIGRGPYLTFLLEPLSTRCHLCRKKKNVVLVETRPTKFYCRDCLQDLIKIMVKDETG